MINDHIFLMEEVSKHEGRTRDRRGRWQEYLWVPAGRLDAEGAVRC